MRKYILVLLASILLFSCNNNRQQKQIPQVDATEETPYGFNTDSLRKESGKISNGETFSGLMNRLGMSASDAYKLSCVCEGQFDVRKIKAENIYDAYYSPNNILEYVVYNKDRESDVVFKCRDSLGIRICYKPVVYESRISDVTIKNSLWNDMLEQGASPLLILELADIYAWTVDFFGLREGDRFRAVYEQKKVDNEIVAISKVNFAIYSRDSTNIYAVRYDQGDGGNVWWNEKGESMKKAFLKAPLKFNRISSKFTYHRKHPIFGDVRAHTGVDYAAPKGTPVMALGDGTVISAGWGGGGGNTVKIRHNSVYTTAYLHLSKYGPGIKAGVRVRQGQVIGYVGSTGNSTGPHLDFRVWKNGTPVNPLTLESPSAEPIKESNRAALDSVFNFYRPLF